jgi:hypothetical protein
MLVLGIEPVSSGFRADALPTALRELSNVGLDLNQTMLFREEFLVKRKAKCAFLPSHSSTVALFYHERLKQKIQPHKIIQKWSHYVVFPLPKRLGGMRIGINFYDDILHS